MTTPTDAELIDWLKHIIGVFPITATHNRAKLLTAADRLAALVEENERLSLIIGAQAKKMHRWKPALEKYADEKNWHCTEFGEYHEHGEKCCKDGWWTRSENGYDIAREALQETNP